MTVKFSYNKIEVDDKPRCTPQISYFRIKYFIHETFLYKFVLNFILWSVRPDYHLIALEKSINNHHYVVS